MTALSHEEHIKNVIKKLQSYKVGSNLIISIYLKNKKEKSGKDLSDEFDKLINDSLTKSQQHDLKSELEIINAYLINDYDKKKHFYGIAFFAGKNMWEIINHDFEIDNQCVVSNTPFILPVIKADEKEARYLFVVVDRKKADIFTFFQGWLEDYKEFSGPSVPQEVKSNKGEYYARNNIIIRHIQNHLHRYLQKISKEIDNFVENKPIQAIFIGGHKPLFHDIKKHINPLLQKKIKGEFITELNIPQNLLIANAQKELKKHIEKGGANYGL